MASRSKSSPLTFRYALQQKANVMSAVILRDMRTRFFGHGLGFIIVVLWPLAHMVLLLTVYLFLGRRTPYGDSMLLFFATGLIPTLSFLYVSRHMAMSLIGNKPMLMFPAIKATDVLFGRAALEIVASFLAVVLMFLFLVLNGENPIPHNIPSAAFALMATIFVAIGVGIFIGALSLLAPGIVIIYSLFTIVIYLLSGTMFVVSALPAEVGEALAWNPVMHGVEWMRTAYYPDYPKHYLYVGYMLTFGLIAWFVGLGLERVLRTIV
jgi:capsular polysaccharide transport system permease protein